MIIKYQHTNEMINNYVNKVHFPSSASQQNRREPASHLCIAAAVQVINRSEALVQVVTGSGSEQNLMRLQVFIPPEVLDLRWLLSNIQHDFSRNTPRWTRTSSSLTLRERADPLSLKHGAAQTVTAHRHKQTCSYQTERNRREVDQTGPSL